jgi:hypothetical protein
MPYVLLNVQNFVRGSMFYKLLLHCTNYGNSTALTSMSPLDLMYVIVTCLALLLLFDFS